MNLRRDDEGTGLGISEGRIVHPQYLPPERIVRLQGISEGRIVHPQYLPPERTVRLESDWRKIEVDWNNAYHFGTQVSKIGSMNRKED